MFRIIKLLNQSREKNFLILYFKYEFKIYIIKLKLDEWILLNKVFLYRFGNLMERKRKGGLEIR